MSLFRRVGFSCTRLPCLINYPVHGCASRLCGRRAARVTLFVLCSFTVLLLAVRCVGRGAIPTTLIILIPGFGIALNGDASCHDSLPITVLYRLSRNENPEVTAPVVATFWEVGLR